MATRPSKIFNQHLKEIYRKNSTQAHQQQQQKPIYFYRKGRIPTVGSEKQEPGYVRSMEPSCKSLKFSNDPHRVQAGKSQLRRQVTLLHNQINQQKFFRKVDSTTVPKKASQQASPKRRVITQTTSPESKTQLLPLLLRKQSNYLNKMRIAVESLAEKDMAVIQARAVARSVKHLKKQKMMLQSLKGKCFYAMIRDVDIPNSFST